MKITKRKNCKKPIKATLSDGTGIIVPRQSQFGTPFLKHHGCPFVSAYEVLQFCGRKDMKIKKIYRWFRKNFPKRFRATLTIRGLTLGLRSLLKDYATVKYFPPKAMTETRVKKYLKAGSIIIMVRRKPVIHYYVIVGDTDKDGKWHTYILNAGKCKKTTVKAQLRIKSNNKHYGGMIVITRKKAKKK